MATQPYAVAGPEFTPHPRTLSNRGDPIGQRRWDRACREILAWTQVIADECAGVSHDPGVREDLRHVWYLSLWLGDTAYRDRGYHGCGTRRVAEKVTPLVDGGLGLPAGGRGMHPGNVARMPNGPTSLECLLADCSGWFP
jgi:hypothetical protein